MKLADLKTAAAECLSAAFKAKPADSVPQPHVLHAAVSVLSLPDVKEQ